MQALRYLLEKYLENVHWLSYQVLFDAAWSQVFKWQKTMFVNSHHTKNYNDKFNKKKVKNIKTFHKKNDTKRYEKYSARCALQ